MSEWLVVSVLITLIGLVATVVTPIVRLNTTITKLTTIVDVVKDSIKELTSDNSEGHRRLWEHNAAQDEKLSDHDKRLDRMEVRK